MRCLQEGVRSRLKICAEKKGDLPKRGFAEDDKLTDEEVRLRY